jgi:small GTP-binding protein
MKTVLKFLLLGDSGVGKTCGIIRYANDAYSETFISTIGIDYKIKLLDVNNQNIKLQIWDTAGQERFRSLTASYINNNADIMMLCYDVSDKLTFANLENWIRTIKAYGGNIHKTILIGTKMDKKDLREVSKEEAMSFCLKHDMRYYEMCGKTGENVEYVFHSAVRLALNLPTNNLISNAKPKPKDCVSCSIN